MKILEYILIAAASIGLFSCANPQPPSGGLRDTTPPEITETSPKPMTKNFNGNSVEIDFSNYMDKTKVIENITIFPNIPAVYDWSGKSLTIEFTEKLQPNATYAILVGTDYTDYLKNKPTQGYSLVFSTSDQIDSCMIKGKLLGDKAAGNYIFCYRIDNIAADTLDPRNTKPDFRVQIGTSGLFSIPALKAGKYRLFSVSDELRDGIYTEGTDAIGTAPEDVVTSISSTPFVSLPTGKKFDKLPPSLYYAEASNSLSIRADFSEALDTASVRAASFIITDSAGRDTLPVRFAYVSNESAQRATIIAQNPLTTGRKYKLTALPGSIRDTAGNAINDSVRSAIFVGSSDADSSAVAIAKQTIRDSTSNFPTSGTVDFVFSAPLVRTDSSVSWKLTKADSTEVPSRLEFLRPNHLRVSPKEAMESYAMYRLQLKFAGIPKLKDTSIVLKWRTQDSRANSEVTGSVRTKLDSTKSYMVRIVSKDGKFQSETKLSADGKWLFGSIPSGQYRFCCYEDVNADGIYFTGSITPFRHSARMIEFRSEIKVPPRWRVENVILAE